MSSADLPAAAIFDFDGTLTVRDTSVPFLRFVAERRGVRSGVGPLVLAVLVDLPRALGRRGPGGLAAALGRWQGLAHERLARARLSGLDRAGLEALGEAFAAERLPAFLRPGALERLRWHRDRGHTCVLVSASLEAYLAPWGALVGFDHVVANRLALDAGGRVSGALLGAHCWGAEKVRRLEGVLGPLDRWCLHVYGNGAGDRALLGRAAEAVRVGRGADLTPVAGAFR